MNSVLGDGFSEEGGEGFWGRRPGAEGWICFRRPKVAFEERKSWSAVLSSGRRARKVWRRGGMAAVEVEELGALFILGLEVGWTALYSPAILGGVREVLLNRISSVLSQHPWIRDPSDER